MNAEKLYFKGAELYEQGKYAEAIDVLSKACENAPYDADTLILLAGCYLNIYRYTDATKVLILADKTDAQNPIIKYNLGYALLCMGRLNDGKDYIKECLQLNPPSEIKKMAKRMLKSEKYFADHLENNYKISLEEEFKVLN
jgi:Flp pilus assembly protein TadD